MTEFTINGSIYVTIKDSGQGIIGIVEELPIVVESPTEEQMQKDIVKAVTTCLIHNPTAVKKLLSIEIPA